uniref:CBS domain-containing protein n=1 Tax=Haptolina brevifila TaxID=156173 RepID=A0A7S2IS18_9EUKA
MVATVPRGVPLVIDHLSPSLLTIDEMDSLRDAARLLKRARITGAPVLDGSSLSGILSRNDLLRAIDKIPSETSVAEFDIKLEAIQKQEVWQIMSESPMTIQPEVSLLAAARVMQEKKLNRLMVKAQFSTMLGIISSTDIVFTLLGCTTEACADMEISDYLLRAPEDTDHSDDGLCSLGTTVSEHMATSLYVMRPDMSLGDAARLLRAAKITGAPVVDYNDQTVGVVSRNDLLKALAARVSPDVEAAGTFATAIEELKASKVSSLMNDTPITVSADAPMLEAAKMMAQSKLNRLMVTGPKDDALCGIISSTDVVFAMLGCTYTLDNDSSLEDDGERRIGNLYRKGIY